MKNLIVFLFVLVTTVVSAQPVLVAPVQGETFYVGEKVTIEWKSVSPLAWSNVMISLRDSTTGTMDWIAFNAPNTGKFEWEVKKFNPHTVWNLTISDGGNVTNSTSIWIVIGNGTRPKPPVLVQSTIKRVVSIEWLADTNHTYQVKTSPDLINWTVAAEGTPLMTNASALFYVDPEMSFFEVYDITP